MNHDTDTLATLKAEVERLKAMPHYHHESYCRKCGAKHEITKSVISENQLKVE